MANCVEARHLIRLMREHFTDAKWLIFFLCRTYAIKIFE